SDGGTHRVHLCPAARPAGTPRHRLPRRHQHRPDNSPGHLRGTRLLRGHPPRHELLRRFLPGQQLPGRGRAERIQLHHPDDRCRHHRHPVCLPSRHHCRETAHPAGDKPPPPPPCTPTSATTMPRTCPPCRRSAPPTSPVSGWATATSSPSSRPPEPNPPPP